MSAEEAKRDADTQARAKAFARELRGTRPVLDADRLAQLIAPRATLERQISPEAFLFSVAGILYGREVKGALFAGELMLVYGATRYAAQDLANRGLRATVELLHEEYLTRPQRMDGRPLVAGSASEGGGRRSQPVAPEQELQTMPKLKAVIATEIGGEPWKG